MIPHRRKGPSWFTIQENTNIPHHARWLEPTFSSTILHSPTFLAKSAGLNNHPAQIMNLWLSGYFREIGY